MYNRTVAGTDEEVARDYPGQLEKRGLAVKQKALFVSVLALLPWIVGCGSGPGKPIKVAKPEQIPPSGVMTLSQEQLLALDWHSPNPQGARVHSKRAVGSGVEFDICFPSNSPANASLDFVSSGEGGKGDLVGGDTSGFRAFALKLTLVAINGQSDPAMKPKLVAGAVIGPTASGLVRTYAPVTLGMAESEKTVIARTPSRTDNIRTIGFHVHMLNPDDWNPSETQVTIRIEPVENAAPAPWLPPDDR